MADHSITETIPLTPDATVQWGVYDIPDLLGYFLVAPDAPLRAVEVLRDATDTMFFQGPSGLGKPFDGGSEGSLYTCSDSGIVMKVSKQTDTQTPVFAWLYANVTLHAGLERIDPIREHVQYSAPEYLAAFVPYHAEAALLPIVLMTREAGFTADEDAFATIQQTVPQTEAREAVYQEAIAACGGEPDAFFYDMSNGNELYLPSGTPASLSVVKLDISPKRKHVPKFAFASPEIR